MRDKEHKYLSIYLKKLFEKFAQILDSNSDFFFEDISSENQRLGKKLFLNILNNYN